jgi:hypothetical protein
MIPLEVAAKAAKAPVSSSRIELTPESKLSLTTLEPTEEVYLGLLKRFYFLGLWRPGASIYSSLVIHNSGVEITTNEGASARAVLVEK